MNFSELEIRKTFELMIDKLVEVRIIGNKFTASGYFKDVDTLLNNLQIYKNKKDVNFYFVMNTINEACYSRQQSNIFVERPKETTSDKDIVTRNWLLIDLDCERPSGVSSTEEELQKSKDKANKIYKYLRNEGFEYPIVAYSGSGTHLLYKINVEAENVQLIKECLLALDMMFSDEFVKIDTAVFNASRITKLYGTLACKGKNTKDRPHRMSKIVKFEQEIKVNDVQLLIKLANNLPEPPKKSYTTQEFDIDEWLSRNRVTIKEENTFNGGRKLILEECPFDASHKGKDAAIFVLNNGAIAFKCFHASCSNYSWQDVRKKFEPNAYNKPDYKRTEPRINSIKKPEIKIDEPLFYTSTTIKQKDRSQVVSIPTGIKDLDKKIIGLNKGEVSCVSGLRASGKSSVISQICLETVQKKYKVALFSGELASNRVLDWLQLQAAGKQYVKPTQYENYFYVDNKNKTLINKWLEEKIFIYNNNYGNNAQKILESVEQCITKNKVDLVVLDNLMAMSLDTMMGDKYEKQTTLILTLMDFAKQHDVHILFVAHPRKSLGFLRTDDISGSGDLTNAVDNVFIVHRVNADFKTKSKQMFGWLDNNELYQTTNVIEVCKNRDLGIQDLFVGLQYELESKRFLNNKYESKHYDWEELSLQEAKAPWD